MSDSYERDYVEIIQMITMLVDGLEERNAVSYLQLVCARSPKRCWRRATRSLDGLEEGASSLAAS